MTDVQEHGLAMFFHKGKAIGGGRSDSYMKKGFKYLWVGLFLQSWEDNSTRAYSTAKSCLKKWECFHTCHSNSKIASGKINLASVYFVLLPFWHFVCLLTLPVARIYKEIRKATVY